MIKLYNTLTKKKDVFKPIVKGKVGMYSCGPTVYSSQHIGNLRSYVFSDILRRVLEYNGLKVNEVINVTDVGHLTSDRDSGEDKVELASKKEGKKAKEITKFYFSQFLEDLKRINVLMPDKWVWASKHIKEQIDMIKKLEKKGFTYKTRDGIYFNSSKFKNYRKFANLNVEKLKAGKRIKVGEKKHNTDFALWKFSEESRQQEWKSPWGVGFPGWHLECSAMSMKYLGKRFDIHTGGEEHISVHHTNEIAQSESVTGKKFVNYWLHGRWLLFDEKKMSKSKGGILTLSELEENGYKAEHLRYLFLLTNYRKQLKFNFSSLDAAKNAYVRITRKVIEFRKEKHKGVDRTKEYESGFLRAVNDDLNVSGALDVFWKTLDDFNFDSAKKIKLLEKFDLILGLNVKGMKEKKIVIPNNVRKLVDKRNKLRKEKKFEEADIVRDMIKEMGFVIEDVGRETRIEMF